jgi:hypothetical protein
MSSLQVSLEKLRAHADQLTPELVARLDDFERRLWRAKRPGRATYVHLGYIVQSAGGKAGLSVLPLMAPGEADKHGRLLALACVHHAMKVMRYRDVGIEKDLEAIRNAIWEGNDLDSWEPWIREQEYLIANNPPLDWMSARLWRIRAALHTVFVPLGSEIDDILMGGLEPLGRQCGADAFGHAVWAEIHGDPRYRAAHEIADRAIHAEIAHWRKGKQKDLDPVQETVEASLAQMAESLLDYAEGRAAKLVETCLNEAARRAK